MKIAIISSVYEKTPPLRYGGIERVLDFLVKGLKTKGHGAQKKPIQFSVID